MRGIAWSLGGALALALIVGPACIDIQEGERGTFGSPCSGGFGSLLQCGRETGGADPQGGGGGGGEEQPQATCAGACQVIGQCMGAGQGEIDECTAECSSEGVPVELLQCIVTAGCDFQACLQQENS